MGARSRRRRRERGAVAVVVALVLAVLLAFLGLTLNAGHGTSVRGELQNATDAAALAAARELNGQLGGEQAGRLMAGAYSALHDTDGSQPVNIDVAADVTFGAWDFGSSTFTPTGTTGAELLATNAVRVRAGREASRGNALPVWLSSFLGNTASMDARSAAVAVGGGPCETRCVIPLAFADCSLVDASGALRCDQTLVFRNAIEDNAGLTGLGDGANTSVERSILRAVDTGQGCMNVSTGEVITIQNGNNFNPLYSGFSALVGRTVSAPVVHPYGCPTNPRFNQDYPVLGFASFTIDYVGNVGPDPRCPDGQGPCVQVTMKCDQTTNDPQTGCGFFGLRTLTSRLVQ
ncbi:MAG TPA: pilus assembly protein TadG-related protein [Anaeromyxobacteraceae bacterium]|nr:pilus assembly protein TadG-related protein [Anaeromyxobacteraceae bacterium]